MYLVDPVGLSAQFVFIRGSLQGFRTFTTSVIWRIGIAGYRSKILVTTYLSSCFFDRCRYIELVGCID